MTRLEIRTLVLSWLDDTQGSYFTSSQVNSWINNAQKEAQKLLLEAGENYYMKPVVTLTSTNQADYVLPVDFFKEHRLEVVVSGTGLNENRQKLVPITTNQQDLISVNAGVPTNYYIKKDRVTLSPVPQNQMTLRLYYSPIVSDLTDDTQSPDVPYQFHEFVAILAALDGFIKDDRSPENLIAKKNEYLKMMKEISEDRTQDQSRQVVATSEYDAGFFY